VLGGPGPTNPAVPRENGGGIASGDLQRVDLAINPASSNPIGPSSFGTLIWNNPSAVTVTATYDAVAYAGYRSIEARDPSYLNLRMVADERKGRECEESRFVARSVVIYTW